MTWLQMLLPAGLLGNDVVLNALVVGTIAAVVSACLGYFVVLRGLSFAGHAVTDVGLSGGAGAFMLGLNPLWGLLAFCVLAAAGVDLLGDRARERDVATGVILALALGCGGLFLFIGTRFAGEPYVLLFGSIFAADPATTPVLAAIGAACLAALAVLYRPLLFCSVSPQSAAARGVPVRLVGLLFIVTMAVGVAEAAQVVGVLLSTALLIGPAASAAYLTSRPGVAIALAAALGVIETWVGIVLAYASYTWPPGGKGWPVSFFITALALAIYLAARLAHPAARRDLPAAAGVGGGVI
ncbi:MAG: metal ABC transporter permease [Chloroflexota bacterium]